MTDGHLLRVSCDIVLVRAVHLDLFYVPNLAECIQVSTGHPARANHAHNLAVLSGEILRAQTCAAAHTNVLQNAVINHGDWSCVLRAE